MIKSIREPFYVFISRKTFIRFPTQPTRNKGFVVLYGITYITRVINVPSATIRLGVCYNITKNPFSMIYHHTLVFILLCFLMAFSIHGLNNKMLVPLTNDRWSALSLSFYFISLVSYNYIMWRRNMPFKIK